MSDKEWEEWMCFHMTLHRMAGDEDLAMVCAWRELFAEERFTLAELRHASQRLALTDGGRWRAQHLEALTELVRRARYNTVLAEEQRVKQSAIGKPCLLCGNSGIVEVPHLECVKLGVWEYPHYTCCVSCSCAIGQTKKQQNNQSREILEDVKKGKAKDKTGLRSVPFLPTLEEYETQNQGWRAQIAMREQQRKERARALTESRK